MCTALRCAFHCTVEPTTLSTRTLAFDTACGILLTTGNRKSRFGVSTSCSVAARVRSKVKGTPSPRYSVLFDSFVYDGFYRARTFARNASSVTALCVSPLPLPPGFMYRFSVRVHACASANLCARPAAISKIATPTDETTLYNRGSPSIELNEIAQKTGPPGDEFAGRKGNTLMVAREPRRFANKSDSKCAQIATLSLRNLRASGSVVMASAWRAAGFLKGNDVVKSR